MSNLLTRQEAAERMRVSTMTVDRLRKAGKLKYVQGMPNGKVWIPEEAIAEYFARMTRSAVPQIAETYRKRRKTNAY